MYEIGEKVGYSNAVSFSKAFHKQYGVNPTEYRNKFTTIKADENEEPKN